MNTEYVWTDGARVTGVTPAEAGEELERIRQKHGGVLHPPDVVKESRRKTAPLHPVIFDCDDKTAVANYRLDRARYVIRHVAVRVLNGEERDPVRAFVNIAPDPDDTGYVTPFEAQADPDMDARLREKFLREINSLQRRYQAYDGLSKVVSKLGEVADELKAAA